MCAPLITRSLNIGDVDEQFVERDILLSECADQVAVLQAGDGQYRA